MTDNNYFASYPDVLTVNQLQEALNIGRNMAYGLISNNKIKHFTIGKSIRIPKKWLIDFVLSSCYDDQCNGQVV